MESLSPKFQDQAPKSVATTSVQDFTAEEMAAKIKSAAKDIRESSIRIRDTVKVLRQSGAIQDMADAVRTAVVASRDIMKEINESAKDLNESGVIKETASAIEDTTDAVRTTYGMIKQSAHEVKELMPHTSSTLEQASNEVKKRVAK